MSEEKKEIQTDELRRIPLTRHMWEDESTFRRQEKRAKQLKVLIVLFSVIALLGGWVLGSFVPLTGSNNTVDVRPSLNSKEKIQTVIDIMRENWLFGKDIEDLDTRLETQALTGITTNPEDPHTEYMSKEEVEGFMQGINRNFVGVGVQYIANDGMNIINKVFRDSPAAKAGVKSGDIIMAIDGEDATVMNADEIKERVTGEEGTDVVLTLNRQGKEIDITITRGQINATVFGDLLEGKVGYLQLYQFGETTADDMDPYLDDFKKMGANKLIIDLRDNGGGFLDSLGKVASRFLKGGTLVMIEEYTDGSVEEIKAKEGKLYDNFGPIIILVNENTASASEVFTMALKEQRDDVTVVGVTTYGKGTVQVTRYFDDSSALKYTTSRWLSPNKVWVNNEGITPDVEVDVPEIMKETYLTMEEGKSYDLDTVSTEARLSQLSLDYLGYEIDRTDGYYSKDTKEAIKKFEEDYELKADGVLDENTYAAIMSAVTLYWHTTSTHDTQLNKALELLNNE